MEDAVMEDTVLLTDEELSVDVAMKAVASASAGGTAVFVGTTRDMFEGKEVLKLEYEAYKEMAMKEMNKLCLRVRERWKVVKCAVLHRLGVVGVGEISVVVAVSAVHRAEAFDACRFLMDELKVSVPIWKKEVYADGSQWKANVV